MVYHQSEKLKLLGRQSNYADQANHTLAIILISRAVRKKCGIQKELPCRKRITKNRVSRIQIQDQAVIMSSDTGPGRRNRERTWGETDRKPE